MLMARVKEASKTTYRRALQMPMRAWLAARAAELSQWPTPLRAAGFSQAPALSAARLRGRARTQLPIPALVLALALAAALGGCASGNLNGAERETRRYAEGSVSDGSPSNNAGSAATSGSVADSNGNGTAEGSGAATSGSVAATNGNGTAEGSVAATSGSSAKTSGSVAATNGNDTEDGSGAKTSDSIDGAEGGDSLIIPLSTVSSKAGFYPISVDGIDLEVIAVEAPDGSIRTAFNTCQVCFDSGRGYYKQSGDVLVCQNCGNRFKMSQIEIESGGCNPWPIFDRNKTVDDDSITIAHDFLKEATVIFTNWKREY
jgi:hypothetical protein